MSSVSAAHRLRYLAVAAALFAAGGISSPLLAQDRGFGQEIAVERAAPAASGLPDAEAARVAAAVSAFINGMASADEDAVWMFASEEDQDAFATEDAVYAAFAETFPVLTEVEAVEIVEMHREGETPFVALALTTSAGARYEASLGLWLNDARDWKVISLEIVPADERIAAL